MKKALVPLAQGCEELEAVSIIDILRRAGIEVITAGLNEKPVLASRGVRLIPDTTLDALIQSDQTKHFDLIVLPGGLPGADNLNNDPRIHALLKQQDQAGKFIAAICAAPKILATAGLLDNKRATAYPGTLEPLGLNHTEICTQAVIQHNNILTSRGPGTAMDFALELISLLAGKPKRDEVEAGLQRK